MQGFSAKAISSFFLVGLISTTAFAQKRSLEFQVDRFEPMPAQGTNTINVAKSDVLPKGSPSAGVFVNYAVNGFLLVDSDDNVATALIENQLRSDLWFSIGVFDFMDLGFVLPIILTQAGEELSNVGFQNSAISSSPELGDLRVVPKIRLLDAGDSGLGFSIIPTVGIPTGGDVFNSDAGIKVEPRAVLDWRSKSGYAISLNGAYLFRPQAILDTYVSDDVVRWGAGIEIPVGTPELKVLATGFGDIGLVKDNANASPIEVDGAIQYMAGDFVMLAGGGAGLNSGVGNPDFRVFGSVGYTPMAQDSDGDGIADEIDNCPTESEDVDGFEDSDGCPDLDNDSDGIADKEDSCTDEAEDIDKFEDADGCPDTDNDGDGILDAEDKCPDASGLPEDQGCPNTDSDKDGVSNDKDKCPDKPEDVDTFEDADGCPDIDNDADGILDADDKCPVQAEDKDGFEDADGCPEVDNDKDGIPDATDQCPNEAEVINGNKDEDGCPDKGATKVKITKTSIQILDKVFFSSGRAKIKKRSFNLLNQVSAILKTNPQITKIRVEGHTDDRGKDAANLTLSQKRADSVMKYLVEAGIDANRLTALGLGETVPIDDNKKSSGRANNRRVEFNIAELNGKAVKSNSAVIKKETTEEKKTPVDKKK